MLVVVAVENASQEKLVVSVPTVLRVDTTKPNAISVATDDKTKRSTPTVVGVGDTVLIFADEVTSEPSTA